MINKILNKKKKFRAQPRQKNHLPRTRRMKHAGRRFLLQLRGPLNLRTNLRNKKKFLRRRWSKKCQLHLMRNRSRSTNQILHPQFSLQLRKQNRTLLSCLLRSLLRNRPKKRRLNKIRRCWRSAQKRRARRERSESSSSTRVPTRARCGEASPMVMAPSTSKLETSMLETLLRD